MRALIYARQSQDRASTGAGIDRQLDQCRALCRARGWQVVAELVDNDVSATSGAARPGLDAVWDAVENGATDAVVVQVVDRLVRKLSDLETVITRTTAANVRVVTTSGDLDLSTDAGRLVGRILASVAAGEGERKAARQRLQQEQAAERGDPPTRRAFGYAADGSLVEPEAAAVRDTFAGLLAGRTLVALAESLNSAGHEVTRGGPWQRGAVRAMLRSPRYCGIRTLRGEQIGPGRWPAIVTADTWRAARALLDDPGRRTNSGTERRWLGGGLYLCGRCGGDVRVSYRSQGERVYTCREHRHLSRVADPVDIFVGAVMVARLSRPDAAAVLVADEPDIVPLRATETELSRRLDTAAGDYADNLLDGRGYRLVRDRVEQRLVAVRRGLTGIAARSALGAVVLAGEPTATWAGLDVGTRRAVLDTFAVVTLQPGRPGNRPFDPTTVEITWRS